MSFKATFSVAGKEYRVLDASFDLHQVVDKTGRVSSETRGGKIHVIVESTNETDLFEWMIDAYSHKSGSIIFKKRDSDATMKELKFTEAYMIDYNESFSSSNDVPMSISFTLSAKEIELGNGKFSNEWV
ncbi:MAG: type VI secretion system tube protein TssD [Niabella sp.]